MTLLVSLFELETPEIDHQVNKGCQRSSDDIITLLYCYLPINDQVRISKLSRKLDRERSIISYFMSSVNIHHVLGITKEVFTIQRSPKEGWNSSMKDSLTIKPYIDHDHIDFNASHDGRFVVSAVLHVEQNLYHSKPKLGVDVTLLPSDLVSAEQQSEYIQSLSFILTTTEIDFVHSIHPLWMRIRVIHSLFALKESLTKAFGVGLITDLTRISFENLSELTNGKDQNETTSTQIRNITCRQFPEFSFLITYIDHRHILAITSSHSIPDPLPLHFVQLNDICKYIHH